MKRILIVGGVVVVGITAAYFAKQKDNNVTLIEADNELGGLLKIIKLVIFNKEFDLIDLYQGLCSKNG